MAQDMFHGIVAAFMPVRDLDRAIDWYMSNMGFDLQFKDDVHHAAGLSAHNDVWLNLVQVKDHTPVAFPDNDFRVDIFFNFQAIDIDQVYRKFQENGVEIVTEIYESHDGEFRCFSAKDVDGNRINIVN